MRRREVRLRKARLAVRAARQLARLRRSPRLLLVQRAALREPVAVETAGPRARPTGFWRAGEYYAVRRVLETRREYHAAYFRVVTDRGAFDLRRLRWLDPWTLRVRRTWELIAAHDVVEVRRPF